MKSCYYVKLSKTKIGIADLCDYYNKGMIITRIHVPDEHRNQGHGRKLLSKIISDADRTGTTLFLEISSYGDVSFEGLEKWYMRNGFKQWKGIYRRRPIRKEG